MSEGDAKLKKLLSLARVGWWEADFGKGIYYCSDFISDLLGIEGDSLPFADFAKFISEEYRERILTEFREFKALNVYEQIFPIHTRYGLTWVSSKVGESSVDEEGNLRVFGMLQCLSTQRMSTAEESVHRLNDLFCRQNSISRSLLDFLKEDDISKVINKILNDVLVQFNGDRAYIFEYNYENNSQSCTYEKTAEGVSSEIANLQNMPVNLHISWWSDRVLGGYPIILSSLDEIPKGMIADRQVLEAQGIKSLMVLPLQSKNGIWGYIGIDVVKEYREWINEDYQWFASLANIISICVELRRAEENARMEKRYLDNLYSHMPVAYVRLKVIYENGKLADYIVLDTNEACDNICGVSFESYTGITAKSQNIELHEQLSAFEEIVNTDKHRERNFRLENVGKICHSVMYSPQQDEIVILFSDMTETFKAHEALDRSEKILRNIYENLPAGIELYDKDGFLIDMNDRELEIFGLETKEIALGVNFFSNPVVPEDLKKIIKSGKSVDFSFKYDFSRLEGYCKTEKRGVIDLITKVTPLFDSEGHLINYLFINIDNTETSNAYSKIQEFEDFFALIGDFAKVGYAHFDALTRDGYAINSWYRNVGEKEGTPLPQIIGIHSAFHPEDRALMLAFLDKVLKGEATNLRNDMRIMRPDGHYTWTRVNVMVRDYRPEDGVIEMACVNYDITELKETEMKLIEAKNKAETLDRLKSAFLANMSHEIRTPLNAIVGFSSLLVDTEDMEDRRQYIAIVQENNELLLQLISDILDLSKIEAGTFDFSHSDVNVNMLCSEIVYSLRMKAPQGVEILFEDHLPECHIWSDKNRLTQVITNFINNALKFTTAGSISLGYTLPDDKELRFYVRDTGTGIPADKVNSIFDRFVKLNTFVHGTGLGLSICKSIVEQMGGTIGVESEEGEGSCFWFTHPYIQGTVENVVENKMQTVRAEFKGITRPKVLVAEDTDSNFLLVSSILKKEYEVQRACTGVEAVTLYATFHPDIILMDLKMPEMDGLEATVAIREKDKHVPIIAVTAFAFDQDKQRSMDAGCNDYLAKPIEGSLLKETLEKWLCK